jgi:hypothetical protein
MLIRVEGPSGPHKMQLPAEGSNLSEEAPDNSIADLEGEGEPEAEVTKPAYVN